MSVSARRRSRCAPARRKPICGPASARTARVSIGSEISTPKASLSGPAARPSDAVDAAGTAADVQGDPARRDVKPLGRLLHCGEQPARQGLGVVVEHPPNRRGEYRLNRARVLGPSGVLDLFGSQQIEIARGNRAVGLAADGEGPAGKPVEFGYKGRSSTTTTGSFSITMCRRE